MARVPVVFLHVVACTLLVACGAVDLHDWDEVYDIMVDQIGTRRNDDNCTHTGTKCSLDCSKLVRCSYTGGDEDFQYKETPCDAGKMCDPYKNVCSSSVKTCPTFKCMQPGTFPDLLDCGTYHICDTNNEDTAVFCGDGYTYDAAAQDCAASSSSTSSCKTTPVPQCDKETQTGVLASDPSIYYVCVSGVPRLYRCNNVQTNQVSSKGHTSSNNSACTARPTSDNSASTNSSLACTAGLKNYADPYNCHNYYACKKEATLPVYKPCPKGEFFDQFASQCRSGTCGKSNST